MTIHPTLAHGFWEALFVPETLASVIAIAAIVSITAVVLTRMGHRHQERLAKIDNGQEPEADSTGAPRSVR